MFFFQIGEIFTSEKTFPIINSLIFNHKTICGF
uniref:Uncharacterized protein n=1 Tax=Siphoviridae sp. ctCCX1 TaxID=2823567 RepID=A0A8S5LDJ3_9CAUD|nr:MAG TPA: hypothetical protein [Siphoviridae sp. ctCCX1]